MGDSRIYIIRGDEIAQVNAEHNYYMMLKNRVEAGEITEEEARNDPSKEALISYIGIGGVELADINQEPFSFENGDLIVLCSDGLYRILNDEAIKLIVRSCSENIPLAAHMLVNTATENRQNNQDNTTAIVVKYKQYSGVFSMKFVRCENGHFYDSEQYTVCPYCSGMDSVGADNVTQPISQKKPDDDIPTQKESNAGYTPTQSISGNGIQQKLKTVTHFDDDAKTIGIFKKAISYENVKPIVS